MQYQQPYGGPPGSMPAGMVGYSMDGSMQYMGGMGMPMGGFGAGMMPAGGAYGMPAYGMVGDPSMYGGGAPPPGMMMAAASPAPAPPRTAGSHRSRASGRTGRSQSNGAGRGRDEGRSRPKTGRSQTSGGSKFTQNKTEFGTKRQTDTGEYGMLRLALPGRAKRKEGQRTTIKRLARAALSHEEERPDFRNLDYTPITVTKPVDLMYPMRIKRREGEIVLLTCLTIRGDESPDEVRDTLRSLADSLYLLKIRTEIMWEDCAVILMCEGRDTLSEEMLEFFSAELRIYDPTLLELTYEGRETVMHLFERSVELQKHSSAREYHPPLQMSLAIKEIHGGGRIASHLWFFTAFCRQIQPEYALLLEPGVKPQPGAVSRLALALDRDPMLAGVTGDISIKKFAWWVPWHMIQAFELAMLSSLDRPFEGLMGFTSNMPTGFVMYRWIAVRGEPLAQYLRAEEHGVELDAFEANRFLSEQRILTGEVLTKKRRAWRLGYESLAHAEAPFPTDLAAFLETKRRQYNGQLFNEAVYAYNCPYNLCCRSRHGVVMRLLLSVQYVERIILMLFRWLLPGSFYIGVTIVSRIALEEVPTIGKGLSFAFNVLYVFFLAVQIILGLGTSPERGRMLYWFSSIGFAIMMFFVATMSIYLLAQGSFTLQVAFTGIGVAGAIFLTSILHGYPHIVLYTLIPFLLLLPVYFVMIPLYSITRLNDATWAIREDKLAFARPEEIKKRETQMREERREAAVAAAAADGAAPDQAEIVFTASDEGHEDGEAAPDGEAADKSPASDQEEAHDGEADDEAAAEDAGDEAKAHPSAGSRRESGGRGATIVRVGGEALEVDEEVDSDGQSVRPGTSATSDSEMRDQVGPLPGGFADGARRRGKRGPGSVASAMTDAAAEDVVEMPNDVAFLIAMCRTRSAFEAHRAVIDALRSEGDRVREMERKVRAEQENKRADFAAFRTRVLGLFLATNFLWMMIVLNFDFTQAFSWAMAAALALFIVSRFLASILYVVGQTLTACIDCWAAVFCCCVCCRSCGRFCGRKCCVCCLWCAGNEAEDPAVRLAQKELNRKQSGRINKAARQPQDGYDDEMPVQSDPVGRVRASDAGMRAMEAGEADEETGMQPTDADAGGEVDGEAGSVAAPRRSSAGPRPAGDAKVLPEPASEEPSRQAVGGVQLARRGKRRASVVRYGGGKDVEVDMSVEERMQHLMAATGGGSPEAQSPSSAVAAAVANAAGMESKAAREAVRHGMIKSDSGTDMTWLDHLRSSANKPAEAAGESKPKGKGKGKGGAAARDDDAGSSGEEGDSSEARSPSQATRPADRAVASMWGGRS